MATQQAVEQVAKDREAEKRRKAAIKAGMAVANPQAASMANASGTAQSSYTPPVRDRIRQAQQPETMPQIGGGSNASSNYVMNRFSQGNSPLSNQERGQLQGTPGAIQPGSPYAGMSGNGSDDVPTARTLRATTATGNDTSMGTAGTGGSSLRERAMGANRGVQGNSGRPIFGDPAKDEITGVLGRADGKQQMYSRGQLSEMAKNVNTGNYFQPIAKADVEDEASQGSGFDAVREKLREKVLAGGIGSRAALNGLLEMRGQDFDKEGNELTNQAAIAKAEADASGTSFDQQMQISEEQRERRTDLGTAIFNRVRSDYDMDDVGGEAVAGNRINGLTTELLNQIGGTRNDVNGAFNVAKLLSTAVSEAGLPIPLFGDEGNFDLQSLDQIAGINFDTKDQNITVYDNNGKAWDIGSDTDLLGLTNFDVTNTDFANLLTAMDKYGLAYSRGPKSKDTPKQFQRN